MKYYIFKVTFGPGITISIDAHPYIYIGERTKQPDGSYIFVPAIPVESLDDYPNSFVTNDRKYNWTIPEFKERVLSKCKIVNVSN